VRVERERIRILGGASGKGGAAVCTRDGAAF